METKRIGWKVGRERSEVSEGKVERKGSRKGRSKGEG